MTSPPSDLAGYYIRYRRVGDTNYATVPFTKDVLAGTIELNYAYTNYEFQIKAYDWSNNESAWSSTVTATSPSNAAPANVTGLTATPGRDAITYNWTAVADTDIKNYEVTFSTSATFASGNTTFLTGNSTTLTVGGLSPSTIYYARVRAVDNGGNTSASWSSTVSSTTTAFPTPSPSDTYAPQSSPTPNVLGGLSYLYITWAPVTLNSNGGAQVDPVTYEVHLSTTTGFTPSGATKVTEVSGTSAVIDVLPGTTTPLSYSTTYYIKLIAKDRDGSAAAGSQGSGTISKVASTDVTSIGADLIVPGTGFVNALVVNTGGSIQSSNYVAATSGYKLDTSGLEINNGSVKASLLTAGTLTSSTGVIQIGSGASIVMNGGYLKSNTYTGTNQASNPSGAGFYLGNDGIRIDQGIVSAAALATGTITASTITLGSTGSIVAGSWTINNSGISIPNGAINAAALNIQIGSNLMKPKYADFEGSVNSYPVSASWPTVLGIGAGTTANISTAQKYTNTQSLLVTNTSGASRGWLLADSQTDYNVAVTPSTRYIISAYVYNASGASVGGYFGIKQQDATYVNGGGITFANTAGWVRYSNVVTTTSTGTAVNVTFTPTGNCTIYLDAIQIEPAINSTVTAPSPWAPPGSTRIDGGIIRTGAIVSTGLGLEWDPATQTYVDGALPAWSIDTQGAATFRNVNVLGSITVGDPSDIVANANKYIIGSAFYIPGESGWIMHGDGWVEFNQIVSNSIDGDSITAGTLAADKLTAGSLGANIDVIGGGGFDIYTATGVPGVDTPIITLNPTDGLVIDPPGTGSITVPANGSAIKISNVSLTATDATFAGNVLIYGTNNYLSGDMLLENGVTDPTVQPTVTSGWSDPSTYFATIPPAGYSTMGLTEDQTGSYWVTCIVSTSSKIAQIYKINKTTGTYSRAISQMSTTDSVSSGYISGSVTRGPDLCRGLGKITVSTTTYYASLVHYAAQSGSTSGAGTGPNGERLVGTISYSLPAKWMVKLYNVTTADSSTSGQYPDVQWTYTPGANYNPFMTSDGTYLYIGAAATTSPNNFTVTRYAYNGTGATTVASSTGGGVVTSMGGMYVGSADFGSTRYLLAGSQTLIWSLTGLSVGNDTATTFQRANDETAWGIHWDGTQFRSINSAGKIFKYSTFTGAEVSRNYGYAWYDSNATGGTHESLLSPVTAYTHLRRGWAKVSFPAPTGGGTDSPDTVRLYVANWKQPDIAAGVTSVLYSSYVSSGVTPITGTSQFASLPQSGIIKSRALVDAAAAIQFKGDGSWQLGRTYGDTAGNFYPSTSIMHLNSGGAQTAAANTWTQVSLGVDPTYPDRNDDISTDFTATASGVLVNNSGWYDVDGMVAMSGFSATAGRYIFRIVLASSSGAAASGGPSWVGNEIGPVNVATNPSLSASMTHYITAGTHVRLEIYQNSSAGQPVGTRRLVIKRV
jgi:hypothetical protein